jgi:DNA-binding NtrC family response regulator
MNPSAGPGCVALIPLSESFARALRSLIAERGMEVAEVDPGAVILPEDAAAVLVLAGGVEAEAIELLSRRTGLGSRWYVVGAVEDHRLAARAVAGGAVDYFALPGDLDLLRRTLERESAAWQARLDAEAFAAEEQKQNGFRAILGRSPIMSQVLAQADRVAAYRDVSVMIGGETGTGKELLARAIHYHSPRSAAPFVEINCTAIPANLIESELFGHEKGAFTGAIATRPGLFELAEGGTIFLDEVGHLPLEAQPKLLRVLEAREVRRVGGREIRPVDVRVIAATHVDLEAAVADGAFREDLYYRLNVVAVTLPPLRDRGNDVEFLAEAFAGRIAASYGMPTPVLTPATRALLRAHRWPGNVRELRNVVERALVLSAPGTLDIGDLVAGTPVRTATREDRRPLAGPLAAVIRAAVDAMLAETAGNKSEAARRLDISRPRLQRILDGATD